MNDDEHLELALFRDVEEVPNRVSLELLPCGFVAFDNWQFSDAAASQCKLGRNRAISKHPMLI